MRLRLDSDRSAARLRNRPSERGGEEPDPEEEAILTASRPKRGFPASTFFAHFPDFERRHATQMQGCHLSKSQGGFGNPVRRSIMSGMEREEERRGKSSGRKGMAQRAERECMAVRKSEALHVKAAQQKRTGTGWYSSTC